jgi:hypothetical protein
MLCVMFGGPVALSVYRIAQPAAVPSVQSVKTITMDPVGEFAKTRIGQVLYSPTVSDNCRRVIFDNRTGSLYEAGHVSCGQETTAEVQATGASRMLSMRAAFNR